MGSILSHPQLIFPMVNTLTNESTAELHSQFRDKVRRQKVVESHAQTQGFRATKAVALPTEPSCPNGPGQPTPTPTHLPYFRDLQSFSLRSGPSSLEAAEGAPPQLLAAP